MTWRVTLGGTTLTADPWGWSDITGWLDTPGVDLRSTRRLGHGAFQEPGEWQPRVLTLAGDVDASSCGSQQELRNRLAGILPHGETATLTVEHGDLTLSCEVQLADRISVSPVLYGFQWELTLASELPWLYAPIQSVTAGAPVAGAGLQWPLTYPLSYGASSQADAVLVNRGNANAWPIFWPRGSFPTGFRIIQDGHVIEWTGAVSNVPIAVDTARSAVEIQGADYSPWLSRDDFRPIPPGGSASIRFEPLGGGQGYLEATVASTYI